MIVFYYALMIKQKENNKFILTFVFLLDIFMLNRKKDCHSSFLSYFYS